MENKVDNDWEQFEEQEEDALSFCNLKQESNSSSALQTPRSNSFSAPEFFEFSNDLPSPELYYSAPDIVFCGKIIEEEVELNEYQKRDYLTMVRSHSLRKPPSYDGYPFLLMSNNDETQEPKPSTSHQSGSLRISSSNSHTHSSAHHHHHHHVQKVNITSLTSMSAKSRRRMFMFGPVKFKPEMELSAIKERQGKRLTTELSPVTVLDGGKAVVNDGRKPPAAARGKRSHSSHWGVVKASLMGRAHLRSLFTRSFGFGCIPFHAAAAAENLIKVAN